MPELDNSSFLSNTQIETLQQLIRQFKTLGKRFADSNIPNLIEQYAQTAQFQQPVSDVIPKPVIKPEVSTGNDNTEARNSTSKSNNGQSSPAQSSQTAPVSNSIAPPPVQPPQQAQPQPTPLPLSTQQQLAQQQQQPSPKASKLLSSDFAAQQSVSQAPQSTPLPSSGTSNAQPTVATLSWQCYHSLLAIGFGKASLDNASSLLPADMGCFSKGAHLPLVPTIPAVVSILENVFSSFDDGKGRNEYANLYFSRSLTNIVQSKLSEAEYPASASNFHSSAEDVVSYRVHHRLRKQTKRDSKTVEKDEKRRRTEGEEKRKRRLNEYHKQLLDHREAFLKYHKQKRADSAKVVRSTKLWVENNEVKRDREEARAEMRRLQALKENDMEAYTSLVQETKNGRLKFLLSETDNYIATINRLIQQQRVNGKEESATTEEATSKNYYSSAHRMTEIVSQPRMLKGGDLKEYQLSGLQWLVSLYNNNLNGILADEMGLGKTIQTIALLSYLMEIKHNNGPFLIIVPLSTLSNWVNEFNKWAPDIIKVVYKGTPDERKRIYRDEVESGLLNVLLTTYEYIMKDKSYLRKLSWQYIIVDEGHRMKNSQSKFAMTLGSSYQSRHRILLTGTPLQNNLPELWALLNFLLPTIFSSVETFDEWFNKPFAAFRAQASTVEENGGEINVLTQEERMLIVHRLHEVLRPFMLRRVKEQVLDQLPEKVEKVLRCALSGWQRKMYRLIAMKGIGSKEKDAEMGGLNNTIMQLRKVCNHPYLFIRDHMVDDDLIRASGKFELLDRMLPKLRLAGHRVLIFSQMVEVMNFLEQFFVYRGFRFLRLDGNTTSDEREKRMYAFNDPDSPYFIFLLSTRAGGLGLNLATADTVIIFDSDWNPMMDAQAQDRAHRIGQKNEVRVFRLLTNSVIEERILARANDKRNLNGLVVEAGKFNSRSSGTLEENKEMMEALLREWSSGGVENVGDVTVGLGDADADVPDDEQLNEMMATYDGEMALYQEVDRQRIVNSSKPALMNGNEIPPWLMENNWPSKYRQLMQSMMSAEPTVKNAEKQLDGSLLFDGDDRSELSDEINSVTVKNVSSALRKRKEVIYDDGLTDFQFQRLLEQEQDVITKPQVGRPSKKVGGHPVFSDLVKAVQELQRMRTANGGLLAELFLEKPSKYHYPDYYELIKSPISLKEILQRLRQAKYDYFEEVEQDFALMSHNARIYNTEQSPVFYMSETLRKEFYARASHCLSKYDLIHDALEMPGLPPDGFMVGGQFAISLRITPVEPAAKGKRRRKDA